MNSSGFGSVEGIRGRLDELIARITAFRKLLETNGGKIDYRRASSNFLQSYEMGLNELIKEFDRYIRALEYYSNPVKEEKSRTDPYDDGIERAIKGY